MILRILFAALLLTGVLAGQQKLRKGIEPGWIKWIDVDVAWIITDEERRAFTLLGNDEERENFAEQFWLRRDPTPDTAENEYKEEHYRRFAYANEHYASDVPGWKTDRGRMYIRFGPPDEIDSHPSGGTWQRPAEQGGGITSTYPFEIWRYRHLDDVGQDIQIQFVDQSMTGEYRILLDPCANDALLHVPNAGLTFAEQSGQSSKLARFQNTDGSTCGAALGGKPASQNPFERLSVLAGLERAPRVRFLDLEAIVNSRVSYNVLPMKTQVDYVRVTDSSVLANVTVQFERSDVEATVNLLGRVSSLTRRPVTTFEKQLEISAQAGAGRLMFQQALPLSPGRYKLDLVAKDTVSGEIATAEIALDVPRFEEGKLGASSLILADLIEALPPKSIGAGMFAIGDLKVRPRLNARFAKTEQLGIYLQVYNASPRAVVLYDIDEQTEYAAAYDPRQKALVKRFPLDRLTPGTHRIRVRVGAPGEPSIVRESAFTIEP